MSPYGLKNHLERVHGMILVDTEQGKVLMSDEEIKELYKNACLPKGGQLIDKLEYNRNKRKSDGELSSARPPRVNYQQHTTTQQ